MGRETGQNLTSRKGAQSSDLHRSEQDGKKDVVCFSVKFHVVLRPFKLTVLREGFKSTMEKQSIVIVSRESALALWQSKHVQSLLQAHYPTEDVSILGITTRGDRILDKKLSLIGGKGLFVKELETAMQEGRADLAVHSLKDVPMQLPSGFSLACVTVREDPRDVFVSSRFASLEDMPEGAVVGTSSLRRELMLKNRYPHLIVRSVRGNVGTRLSKLDAGQFDALIMAGAGLKRLGFSDRIRQWIPVEVSLPAPGQGALGIEIRSDDEKLGRIVTFLNDEKTRAACAAERAVSRALGGSCQVPLAAYAVDRGGSLWLRALVGDHRTGRMLFAQDCAQYAQAEDLASRVVGQLLKQGAQEVLDAVLSETRTK